MGDGDTPLFNSSNVVNCSRSWEDPKCRAHLISRQEAPSLPTEDIINPDPDTLQPIFSRDSWEYYWQKRFGDTGRRVGGYVFRALDSRDRIRPDDGYFDLSTVTADELDSAISRLGMRKEDGSEDKEAIDTITEMREILRQYRSGYLRVYYLAESESGQLVAADENGNVAGFYRDTLDKVWASIKARYPDEQVARFVIDRQTFAGNDESIGLNPERAGAYEPLLYAGALAVTGGLGLFESACHSCEGRNPLYSLDPRFRGDDVHHGDDMRDYTIGMLPYANRMGGFEPGAMDTALMAVSAGLLMLAALLGKRGTGGPVPVALQPGRTPFTRAPILTLPAPVARAIQEAMMGNKRDMATVFMAGEKSKITVQQDAKITTTSSTPKFARPRTLLTPSLTPTGDEGKGDIGIKSNEDGHRIGMFEQTMAADLQTIMDTQLRLQVDVSFDKHHDFLLRNGLATCKSVLDIGTGNGYFCCRVAERHPQISFRGADLKKEMIEQAEVLARQMRLANTTWNAGDVTQGSIEVGNGLFDGIILRYTDSHISEIAPVLQTLKGFLRPGGRLWIITLELDHMHSIPPHDTFGLYKRAIEHTYKKFGIDGHRGTKLPALLEDAGYQVVASEIDPMSNIELGREAYQRYMFHEARLIRAFDPEALSEKDLEEIGRFVETVVTQPGYYGTYGVVMITAQKP